MELRMRAELIRTATIGTHWIVAIEYGEYSHLTTQEIVQVEEWLAENPAATYEWGEEEEFARDEISGLMGHCTKVNLWEMGE